MQTMQKNPATELSNQPDQGEDWIDSALFGETNGMQNVTEEVTDKEIIGFENQTFGMLIH